MGARWRILTEVESALVPDVIVEGGPSALETLACKEETPAVG